jgi:hypothetical protein
MIGALRKIAAERNVYVIFVQADLGDGPAIALYEALGTKETAHHSTSKYAHRGAAKRSARKKPRSRNGARRRDRIGSLADACDNLMNGGPVNDGRRLPPDPF